MQERRQLRQQSFDLGGSYLDDPVEELGGIVSVTHGTLGGQYPVGEMSVREVRERLRDVLNVAPNSIAVIDGSDDVDDDTIVREGQHLSFIRRSGEKGGVHELFE